MSRFFADMGVIQWPMYVGAVLMLAHIARVTVRALRGAAVRAMTVHTILVWGVLNALLGVLGTVLGLAVTGLSVERAGHAAPALVAGGIRVALGPAIFGVLLLTVAVVAWLALQLPHATRVGDSTA